MDGASIRHFDPRISSQGVEQDMDYKTVMVSLALDRPNYACLAVTGDLAERFGARVIGVAASDVKPPLYFADGGYAQKLLDEEAAATRDTELDLSQHRWLTA